MTAASMPKSVAPIPTGLPQLLHSPKTPWHISPALFERIKKQETVDGAGKPFVAVQVINSDPEYAFVLRYFQHQKPPHYGIKGIRCIHNPDQSLMFESALKGMEAAAKTFPPGWNQEEPKAQRAQTIERWKASVAPFSPFQIPSSKRVDKFVGSKIIPLWHGSKQVESICSSGFTYFGKHHFFDKNAKAGAQASTDIGFFGSGIYFTNSSHYASMYHSGTLFLAWVSMREPYPIVNDVPIPKKGADMLKLQGKGAYQNYNAHYIPVTSTDPSSADNMIYHPCHATEQPAWDEYVVFEKTQTLPRFIVELGVDLPVAPSSPSTATVGSLTEKLMALLDDPEIQSDSAMFAILNEKSEALFSFNPQSPLSSKDFAFYNRTMQLFDPKGKIRPAIKQQLTKSPAAQKPDAKKDPPSAAKVTNITMAAATATVVSSTGETFIQKTGKVVSAAASFDPKSLEKTDADGNTPLLNAAKAGDVKRCKALLAAGANPNAISKYGNNALDYAVQDGKHEVIPIFAAYKQLLNADTPLIRAAWYGHAKVCEALLKAGADPSATDKYGRNALDLARLCTSSSKDEVMKLLSSALTEQLARSQSTAQKPNAKEDPASIAKVTKIATATTAATAVSSSGQTLNQKTGDAVSASVSIDPKSLEKTDADGNTPLLNAAKAGDVALCKALLKAGANPNATSKLAVNALHHAARNGKHEVIPLFAAQKQLLNAKATNGDTPLMQAAMWGHPKACEALLKAGADPSIVKNGDNVLHIAAGHRNHEVIPIFAAYKQLLNARNMKGNTPLMTAAAYGGPIACEALLKAGADPFITDNAGQNVLHYWASAGAGLEVISLLATYKQLFNAIDTEGHTPLMLAATRDHLEACETLLKAGADPFIGKNGQNVLHKAAYYGTVKAIPIFAANKQLLNAKDTYGNTPLILAVFGGHSHACEALLKAGADPSITDKNGHDALHIAARLGNYYVFDCFVANKQLLNAKDTDGLTPLMHAASEGHPKVCEALLKAGADLSITKGGILGIGGDNALDLARQSTSDSKDAVIKLLSSYKK